MEEEEVCLGLSQPHLQLPLLHLQLEGCLEPSLLSEYLFEREGSSYFGVRRTRNRSGLTATDHRLPSQVEYACRPCARTGR